MLFPEPPRSGAIEYRRARLKDIGGQRQSPTVKLPLFLCRLQPRLDQRFHVIVATVATVGRTDHPAETGLPEFDTPESVRDLSGHDAWRVVADLQSGLFSQIAATDRSLTA